MCAYMCVFMHQGARAISSKATCLRVRLSYALRANLSVFQEDLAPLLPKLHRPQSATSPLTKAASAKPELACGTDSACYMGEESHLAHSTKVYLLDNVILKCVSVCDGDATAHIALRGDFCVLRMEAQKCYVDAHTLPYFEQTVCLHVCCFPFSVNMY